MKVLHIITGLSRGGAEQMLFKLLKADQSDKNVYAVISLAGEGVYSEKIRKLGVPVWNLGIRNIPWPAAVLKLRKLIRDFKPDILQGWMYHGNIAALFGKYIAASRAKVIWNIRQTLYDLKSEKKNTRHVIRFGARLSRCVSAIIYNAGISAVQHGLIGYAESKAIVLPNGFDLEKFAPDDSVRKRVRGELGLTKNQTAVMHIARFHPTKNHKGFIEAAKQLLHIDNFIFVMIGTNVTENNQELMTVIGDNRPERFCLLGERDDVADLLKGADLFCLSSCGEGFPNVLGEAMLTGIPCVATDVGECKQILDNYGKLVPAGNERQISEAIRSIAKLPESEREILSAQAREHIVKNYSINAIAKQYDEVYRAALEKC